MLDRRFKLTKTNVDSCRPEGKRYRVFDTELTGFFLRVSPSGSKVYAAFYRSGGGGRRNLCKEFTIGKHGTITADQARAEAKKLLAQAALGTDPQEDRQKLRDEITINELLDIYIQDALPLKKETTIRSDMYRINSHIRPLLGNRRVLDITTADCEKFIVDVALLRHVPNKPSHAGRRRSSPNVSGGKGTATRSAVTLSAIMTFAIKRKIRLDHPVRGIKIYPSKKCERFLSNEEIGRLGKALAESKANAKALQIIRLWIITGARKMEIQALRKEDVDFNFGFIRLKDSKGGYKIIHLGPLAVELLQQAADAYPASPYFFPGDKSLEKHFIGTPKIWRQLSFGAGITDVRIHDLRHTFASVAVAGGQSLAYVQKIMGHKDIKTTMRYAHLAPSPVKDTALEVMEAIGKSLTYLPLQETPAA